MAAFSGVVAVVLALAAFWYSMLQGIRAQRAIAHERRTVFELEVLRDMLRLIDEAEHEATGMGGVVPAVEGLFGSGALTSRLAFFGPDELLLWRSFHNKHGWIATGESDESIPPPPAELYADHKLGDERVLDVLRTRAALHRDVQAAIQRRVTG
jgi:hypothetical protein